MEKGFLTKEQEQYLAEALDKAIKSKNVIVEFLDGIAAKIVIGLIDDNLADRIKLPASLKVEIQQLIDFAIEGDLPNAEAKAAEILNGLIDIPVIGEAEELTIFKGALNIVIGAIIKRIKAE